MSLDSSGEADVGERVLPSSIHSQGRRSDGGAAITTATTTDASLGVLSRTSLYTSMAAHNNTRGIDPSDYMRNQLSTPKSIQESTLTEMWLQVSADYHRGTSMLGFERGGDVKSLGTFSNRGARPITAQDVEETLRHRAITLVGGGLHRKIPKIVTSTPPRRKKRTSKTYKMPSSANVPPDVYRTQMLFLRKLHREWIRHAWEVLDGTSVETVRQRLAELPSRNSIEWVGSKVRIDDCREQPSRIGSAGVLVAETTNTWRVVSAPDGFEDVMHKSEAMPSAPIRLQTFVLPKKATALAVLLPTKPSAHQQRIGVSSVAPATICIVLNEAHEKGT